MEKADRVYYNGTIYTVDPDFRTVPCMAVGGGKILYTGGEAGLAPWIGPETERIDLKGRTVTPGFLDSHIHLRQFGRNASRLSTKDKSKEQILEDVAEALKTMEPGQWLVSGTGWDNDWWDDPRYPSTEELDAVSPKNPVYLRRAAGGVFWANSLALAAAGIDPASSPALRNADGAASGCFPYDLAGRVEACIPDSPEEYRRDVLKAQELLLSYGVVGFTEAITHKADVDQIEPLYREGRMKLRYYAALHNAVGRRADPDTHALFLTCPRIGEYGDRFTIRTIKMLIGGTVGAKSAAHYEEFLDDPGNFGKSNYTDEELDEAFAEADRQGMQIMCHAIGDRDIDQYLEALERLDRRSPVAGKRSRIEHFQLVRGDSPERAKALGLVPSMQAMHAPNSSQMALRRLGPERAKHAYAMGEVLRRVGMVAGGSDGPVATPSVLSGIHAAVTRTNDLLEPKGGFFPENAISREDALRSYTIWAAYAQFAEDRRGSLEPGKYADYVILDRDLMTVPADEIQKIRVLETVIGGRTEYRAE